MYTYIYIYLIGNVQHTKLNASCSRHDAKILPERVFGHDPSRDAGNPCLVITTYSPVCTTSKLLLEQISHSVNPFLDVAEYSRHETFVL